MATNNKAKAPAKKAAPKVVKAAKKDTKPAAGTKSSATKKVEKALRPTKVVAVKQRKAYTRPQFRRPFTMMKAPAKKPNNNTKAIKNPFDSYRILKHPWSSDVAMKKLEANNTLTFIVDPLANKTSIKKAVYDMYKVKTVKINTLITPTGEKKAYVRLHRSADALEIAGRIGIV
jgi:large subunit ribosomal protein L23Ae